MKLKKKLNQEMKKLQLKQIVKNQWKLQNHKLPQNHKQHHNRNPNKVNQVNQLLGLMENFQMEQGDTLVLFTDGVTEAMDAKFNEFGVERLDKILSQQTSCDCQQIVEAIKAGIKDFVDEAEQSDDITMLVVKRLA